MTRHAWRRYKRAVEFTCAAGTVGEVRRAREPSSYGVATAGCLSSNVGPGRPCPEGGRPKPAMSSSPSQPPSGPTPANEPVEISYRSLVEAVRDYAIFTLDPAGHVTSWSPGAEKIKGYAAHEIIGKHFSIFYTPEVRASGWPQRELAIATANGRFEEEGWRVRKDGSQFWANVVLTAIHDKQGVLTGFAKITRDMSERRRLEELESSSRRMSVFLATLSHELRNPLAPVRNAVNLMMLERDLSPALSRCRDMIDRQITHLTRLVDDLLDVGRITSGKVGLRLRNMLLADMVERAVEASRPAIDLRGQHVEIHLPEQPLAFRGDLIRLVQVLQNLLVNASKFSPPDSVIAVHGDVAERLITLRVSDSGCGIHPDALEEIFNLFVQHDPMQGGSQQGGLGIGLSLCRSLVELHGGTIKAHSEGIGMGSTFTIQLPYITAREHGEANDRPPSAAVLRVMVIDDNRDSADSLAMLLEGLGHEVEVAYDGRAARTQALAFSPHLMLVDIAMPVMDGFELLRALRGRPELAGTVFVAMTGFGQPGDHTETRAAGFHAHLVKPVEMPHLEMLLATVGRAAIREG